MNGKTKRLTTWVFSLQGKFIIAASVCILTLTTIGNLFFLFRESKLYQQDLVNQRKVLAEISRLMLTNVMVYNELGMMDDHDLVDYMDYFIMNLMERDTRVRYVEVLDRHGKVLAHTDLNQYGKIYQDRSIQDAVAKLQTDIGDGSHNGEAVMAVTTPLNIDTKCWGVLRMGVSAAGVHQAMSDLKMEIHTITGAFWILSIIIVSIGAKLLAKPVLQLTSAMDGIRSSGDFAHPDFRFEKRRDELGRLQNSFLWMLQRLWEGDQERNKTLEMLGRTEKMASIGRLAAGVAHEINNPLGGMALCFRNLMNENPDKEKRGLLVEAVNDGFDKIKRIVDQLLDFSRATVADPTPVNPNVLLEKVLFLLKYDLSKQNINVARAFSPDIPSVMVDENKMAQVMINIILNATQAMEGGGTLIVTTTKEEKFCSISIEDTGGGIPPDIVPYIFDPFFTTKKMGQGTGLGLSVSKGIVEKHRGVIELENHPGQGARFIIKLPWEDRASQVGVAEG